MSREIKVILEAPNNEKQEAFLTSKTKHTGYGGARGGGKSWSVRNKAKRLCLNYSGIKVLIVRRTYPELLNNHIMPLQGELPRSVARYNKTEKLFKFVNGSTIKFGYCNSDNDLDQYQGAEYDVIFIDEATQLKEMWIKKITACVRGVNDFPKRLYYTCNPGGVSHAYFKRLFIDKKYEKGEKPEDYVFIQALVEDNKALMKSQPDYIKQLEALPPKLKEAWLYGRWDIFEGQFFEDLRITPDSELCREAGITEEEAARTRRYVHAIEPFEIPDSWEIYRSFDWGYAKPFDCSWYAVDGDSRAYQILQYYGCNGVPNEGLKLEPGEVFGKIAELEREHRWLRGKRILGVADSAIWNSDGGPSIIDSAIKNGLVFQKADKSRIAGWMQIHYRLSFDGTGRPMLYIFNTCRHALRTLPLMQYSEACPEDMDTTLEDHYADSLRYFCMMRPIEAGQGKKSEEQRWGDPLEELKRSDKERYKNFGR